jgi:hypothetical protein
VGDLIVKDSEYTDSARTLNYFGSLTTVFMSTYQSCLDAIKTEAVVSGDTSDGLALFAEQSALLIDKAEMLLSKIAQDMESFVSEIDKADSYLYGS